MSDVVERLRHMTASRICQEAADEIERLQTAQAQWQPIETVPEAVKDGRGVLLARIDAEVGEGYWFPRDVGDGAHWEWDHTTTPTHWRPLPEPPTRAARAALEGKP